MPEYRHTWNIIYMTVWIQTRFIFDLLSITFHLQSQNITTRAIAFYHQEGAVNFCDAHLSDW